MSKLFVVQSIGFVCTIKRRIHVDEIVIAISHVTNSKQFNYGQTPLKRLQVIQSAINSLTAVRPAPSSNISPNTRKCAVINDFLLDVSVNDAAK